MVVIALCHTSSSNAGADALEQLNDDDRMFVVRNWDITSPGAAEAAQREVFFFHFSVSSVPPLAGFDFWRTAHSVFDTIKPYPFQY